METILYNNQTYYKPNRSKIYNLFNINSYDDKEHFFALITLKLLIHKTTSNKENEYVIIYEELESILQKCGYNTDQVVEGIKTLQSKGLIEFSGQSPIYRKN